MIWRSSRLLPVDPLHGFLKLCLLPFGAVTRERGSGAVVLCYHRVGAGTGSQVDLPVELFAWQMAFLRRRYSLISLDELVSMVQERRVPISDVAAITFDDGYEDVYTHAFPVLRRFDIPATVYLATAYIGGRKTFPFLGPHGSGPMLSWGQITEMHRSGLVAVGAHTHHHTDLSTLSADHIAEEIELSNASIASEVGHLPRHFAYPWGKTSADARSIIGSVYRTAAIGGTRKNRWDATDLMRLYRVPVQRSDGRAFFRLKVESYLWSEDWVRGQAERWRL